MSIIKIGGSGGSTKLYGKICKVANFEPAVDWKVRFNENSKNLKKRFVWLGDKACLNIVNYFLNYGTELSLAKYRDLLVPGRSKIICLCLRPVTYLLAADNKEDFRLVFMRGNEVPDDFNLISYLEGLKVKYLSKLPVKNKLYLISNEDITRRKYVFN